MKGSYRFPEGKSIFEPAMGQRIQQVLGIYMAVYTIACSG